MLFLKESVEVTLGYVWGAFVGVSIGNVEEEGNKFPSKKMEIGCLLVSYTLSGFGCVGGFPSEMPLRKWKKCSTFSSPPLPFHVGYL